MDEHPTSTPGRFEALPVIPPAPPERADAARNRQKILDAATHLVSTRGAASLSLDEVARHAGVGVGTVYRRFGDLAGLVNALVDERERQFQAAFITGPPPLGPGAPPDKRLHAFLHALLEHTDTQWELLYLSEKSAPTARYSGAPYRLHHIHLVSLLRQLVPAADTHYLADALLAPLAPSLIIHQRRVGGFSIERMKAGLDDLVAMAVPDRPTTP